MRVEISRRIKEEFENGREYYAHHGQALANLPNDVAERPSEAFLNWHNENIYSG
jgi:putative restriction endonuclease